MPPTNAAEILEGLAALYKERNAVYKDNWKHIGPVMAGFFPDGIKLTTPLDHIRFHLFMLAVVKLTRYTNNWANGHSDSLRDASVYLAMLDAADIKPGAPRHADPVAQALMEIADPYNHTVSGEARRKARAALSIHLQHEPIDFGEDDAAFAIWFDAHRAGNIPPLPKKQSPTRCNNLGSGVFYCAKVTGHGGNHDDCRGHTWPLAHLNCACWATGAFVWVEGCDGHPRESIT